LYSTLEENPERGFSYGIIFAYIFSVLRSSYVTSKYMNAIKKEEVNWGEGQMYYPYQFDNLMGKMMTFIETMGFEASREKAVKDHVKSLIRAFSEDTINVPEPIAEKIRKSDIDDRGRDSFEQENQRGN